ELHGEVTNSPAAGMNQHALTRLQLRGVEQRLPRGQRSQRHGRCADVMKRVRFEREFWFANDDIISVRAVACRIRQAVNLIASFELRYARPDFFHDAGQVPSKNEREFMRPEVFHVAFTNFPIDRVHSRCVNADENFTRLWLRTPCVFVLKDFRSAVVVNSNRFHCSFLFCEQQSAAHRALEKDYVSCLSITDWHAPPRGGMKTFAYLRRESVFRETATHPSNKANSPRQL